MDKLIKVLEKIVTELVVKVGYIVTDDNDDSSFEGEEIDPDTADEHVSDDNEREQWFASIKVTHPDGTDALFDSLTFSLTKVFDESPTHPFDHSTQSPMVKVNNWTVGRGHVLVVHSTNGVELFENYTKVSTKRK
jgi:hypothetical protein